MDSSLEGVVITGDQRGRTLGFPTANLRIGGDVELADGVYGGVVELAGGATYQAAISVGRRPHYYEAGERLVEAYLLDFDGDLYGETVRLVITARLRDQGTYETEEQLVAQIATDVETIRSLSS
jgi:riboflavin kinase/FMN adenylyltransferase